MVASFAKIGFGYGSKGPDLKLGDLRDGYRTTGTVRLTKIETVKVS